MAQDFKTRDVRLFSCPASYNSMSRVKTNLIIMLTFFSDTDCDITPKECAAYGIKLISMPYTVGEQVIYPYIDFEEFDSHKFYDMLRAGTMPTTSALSEEAYTRYFEPEFAAGNDILYVHFSSGTSNTFTIMNQAVEKMKAK